MHRNVVAKLFFQTCGEFAIGEDVHCQHTIARNIAITGVVLHELVTTRISIQLQVTGRTGTTFIPSF